MKCLVVCVFVLALFAAGTEGRRHASRQLKTAIPPTFLSTMPEEGYCQHHFTFTNNRPSPGYSLGAVASLRGLLDQELLRYNTTVAPANLVTYAQNPTEVITNAEYKYTAPSDFGGTIVYRGNCTLWAFYYAWLSTTPEFAIAYQYGLINFTNIQFVNFVGPNVYHPAPYFRQSWFWRFRNGTNFQRAVDAREGLFKYYNDNVATNDSMKIQFSSSGVDTTNQLPFPGLPCCALDVGGVYDFESPAAWAAYRAWEARNATYRFWKNRVIKDEGNTYWSLYG